MAADNEQQYDNEMRGVLFTNENKRTPKSPDMTGRVTIEGKEYRLAAWTQTARSGGRYLSISVTDPDNQAPAEQNTETEKIPF